MNYGLDGFGTLILEVGGLVIFLVLVLWLARRRNALGPGGSRDCSVVRTLPVGPKERILVVRVGTRHLVVGVGASSMSLLCELNEPLPQPDSGATLFGDTVRKALGR